MDALSASGKGKQKSEAFVHLLKSSVNLAGKWWHQQWMDNGKFNV
jgi:hypothetical protein